MYIMVKDLWKVYRNGVIALRAVSFELVKNKLVILAGPNGAGKTTLIRIMDGEISPTRGHVLIDELTPDEARLKGLFGVMPQEAQLHEYLSVREYLYYLALIKGLSRNDAKREVSRLIEDFMLHEYIDERIEHLSGGYKKRVLLAQAFIGNPQLLFLDEPTVGLDPEMRIKLWNIVMKYINEYRATAILVTHYLDEVKEYADRVLLLHRGKLIFDGSPKDLLKKLGYMYRVRMKINNDRVLNELPIHKYLRRDSEVELLISNDDELITLVRFIESHRDYVTEFIVERPSLEESYMEVLRVGKPPQDLRDRHALR